MPLSSRLDPVVRLRHRTELTAAAVLARAQAEVAQCQCELTVLRERAQARCGTRAPAELWELGERVRERQLAEIRLAEARLRECMSRAELAAAAHRRTHQATEVVRRVADRQRDLARRGADYRESRALDEVAGQQAARASSAE